MSSIPGLQTLEVPVEGMDCMECTQHVQHALQPFRSNRSVFRELDNHAERGFLAERHQHAPPDVRGRDIIGPVVEQRVHGHIQRNPHDVGHGVHNVHGAGLSYRDVVIRFL